MNTNLWKSLDIRHIFVLEIVILILLVLNIVKEWSGVAEFVSMLETIGIQMF